MNNIFIIFSNIAAFDSQVIFSSLRKPGLNQDLNKCLISSSKVLSSGLIGKNFIKSSLIETRKGVPFGAIFNLRMSSCLFPSTAVPSSFNDFSFFSLRYSAILISTFSLFGENFLFNSLKKFNF